MRAIWRALFWLADGHWSATGAAAQQRAAHAAQTAGTQLLSNGTAAAATALNSATSGASSAMPSAATVVPSTGDPLMLTLIKKIIPSLFIPALTGGTGQNGSNSNSTLVSPKARYPSWLSDVKFLNTLTPYPTINNMIIDTLEGQLITLLVVIAFILLFLIREWVVQQQPMANIAEGEREAALRLIANDRPEEQQRQQIQPLDFAPAHPNVDFGGLQNDHQAQEADDDIPLRFGNHSPAPSLTDSDDGQPILERHAGPNNRFAFEDEFADDPDAPHQRRALYENVVANWPGDRDAMFRAFQEQEHADRPMSIPELLQGLGMNELRDQDHANAPNAEDAMRAHNPLPAPTGPIAELPAQPEDFPNDPNPASETPANGQTAPTIGQLENHQPPTGISERLVNWFWGDVTLDDTDPDEAVPEDDEQIIQDPALEDPFVPVMNNRVQDPVDDGPPGGGAPAGDPGLDPNDMDAIEGDDFEGIMDLIGMQGPIFGLLQNGVFCALLIAFTVAIGIWLPYLWGKIALVLLANPLELIVGVPMTAISVVADIALDTLIGVLGYLMYWFSFIFKVLLSPLGALVPLGEWIPRGKSVTSASLTLIDASTNRLNKVMKAFLVFHDSDIPMFSVISHQALKLHQARLSTLVHSVYGVVKFVLHDFPLRLVTLGVPGALSFDFDFTQIQQAVVQLQGQVGNFTKSIMFSAPGAKLLNADAVNAASAKLPVDYDLAVWDTKDRIIAISMGYLLASMMGFLYLRVTGLLAGTNRGQRIEGMVAEVLLQAGGVMKVILIIGIEMIVFPLYCGTLLDIALLPLFSNATISSRIAFTIASPLTSLFVHWFVGTCYMFHFALFVSMCRKILRSGVLCKCAHALIDIRGQQLLTCL
jgi:E3 ubiquitin-protein ligase MARCH6